MNKLTTYSAASAYLDNIFRDLNEKYFGGFLETPVITIQSTPGAFGHFTCGRVWRQMDGDRELYEINISAESLARPVESVVATLLHEMVHMYCQMSGIKDTSRGCTYHNKKFKDEAEKRGLLIEYSDRIGWSITSPSPDLIEYIHAKGWMDILIERNTYGLKHGKKPSSTRKYQCPFCGMSVRATKSVNILCGDCNRQMELCS